MELLGSRKIALLPGSGRSWLAAVHSEHETVDAGELASVLTAVGHGAPLDVSAEESEQGG